MKTLIAAVVCLHLLAAPWAQCQQVMASTAVPDARRVTLELKDTPLKSAIEQVIQFGSAKYRLDPALDKPPYDGIMVSIKLVNVPFPEALTSLLQTHGLAVRVEDSAGVIYPLVPMATPNNQGPMVAGMFPPRPDLVTMVVPRMQIGEALRFLYRDAPKQVSYAFQGRLAMAIMPGATFRQFPRDEAADVLLVAAGLVPPTGSNRLVKSAGPADLSAVISYVPLKLRVTPYLIRGLPGNIPPAVAVAAYRTANSPNLLLVVLANQEQAIVVLDSVLGASGVNYVLGDMSPPPNPEAPTGPKLVSIRLYGVTLDQALKSVLPSMNLRYRMQGPTVFIESPPQ